MRPGPPRPPGPKDCVHTLNTPPAASFQFKLADTVFQKDRWSLSGKVGGNRDDIAIALQLGAYW